MMTPAEFRSIRDHLGLSHEWLAEAFEVTDRTIRRWESGAAPIPTGVAQRMGELAAQTRRFVQSVVREVRRDPPDPDGARWVQTYRDDEAYRRFAPDGGWSAGWHRAAMQRVKNAEPSVRLHYAGDTSGASGIDKE